MDRLLISRDCQGTLVDVLKRLFWIFEIKDHKVTCFTLYSEIDVINLICLVLSILIMFNVITQYKFVTQLS